MPNSGASYNRTRNSLKNSMVALVIQVASMLIGFFGRRIFIHRLGVELMGLSSTAASILDTLNLAELGISTAIAVTLYKPLFEKDEQSIKEIVAIQGKFYRIIGSFVFVAAMVVMLFMGKIFAKTDLPISYAYVTFCVLLYSSLLWYFVNYKKILLIADQKNYKILLSTRLVSMIRQLVQIYLVLHIANVDAAYFSWLGLDALSSTIGAIILARVIHKTYPFLSDNVRADRSLIRKYPGILKKTGCMAFHKFGGYAMSQSGPIFIYAYASLTTVGLYANYTLLTVNLGFILGAMYSGIGASIGDMVAEGNKNLMLKVFKELFSSRVLIVGVCCICLWFLTEPFIKLWLGPEYVLGRLTLVLIVAQFFLSNIRNVVDDYLTAFGLFWDIWSPLAEAGINISLAIILGSRFGLNGILAATLTAQLLLIFIWKPIFLFWKGLKEPLSFYVKLFVRCFIPAVAAFAASYFILSLIKTEPGDSISGFLVYAMATGISALGVFILVMRVTEPSIKGFALRISKALGSRRLGRNE